MHGEIEGGLGLGFGFLQHRNRQSTAGIRVFFLNKEIKGRSEEFQVPLIRRSEVTISTSRENTD